MPTVIITWSKCK